MIRHQTLALALLFLLSLLLSAAPEPAAEPVDRVITQPDEVVVATRRRERLADLPATAYRLDPDYTRLHLQPRTMPEALRDIPGIMLQKTGHGMTSPFLRGYTGQRVVLVVDGVRYNNSYLREGPNQYWNLVDGYFIDNLEVLMGPASVLYGSDAIGGVVNAYSSPLERGDASKLVQWMGGRLDLRYHSGERSFSEHVEANLALRDDWSFRAGITRQDFGDLRSGDAQDNPNTDYEQWGTNLRATHWFDDDHTLELGLDLFDQDDVNRVHRTIDHVDFHDTLSKGSASDKARYYDQDHAAAFARYSTRNGAGAIEAMDITLSYQYLRELYRRERTNGKLELSTVWIRTVGAELRFQSPSAWGTWTYGIDYYHDFVQSQGSKVSGGVPVSQIQGNIADDADYDLFGAYAQNELPLSEVVSLITGLRYTYAHLEARDVDFVGSEGSVHGEWQAVTASARLLWKVLPDDRLSTWIGISQGFRAPNLADATYLGDFGGGTEAPTADLDAERYLTYEAGLKSQGDRWLASLVYYYTQQEDRIGRIQKPTATKRNLEDGYIQGIEAFAKLRYTRDVWQSFSVTWQEGQEAFYDDRNLNNELVDKPISRLMPFTVASTLSWEPIDRNVWVALTVEGATRQTHYSFSDEADNRFPPAGTPGYVVAHLRAGCKLGEQTDLVAGIENLTDEAYRIHGSGVNEPGRSLVVSLQYRF